MSNNDDVWRKLASQVSSPWDWFAIGGGAALGAGVTIATGGVDLGASIGAGATGGLTAKKAIDGSLVHRRLRKRATEFLRLLEQRETDKQFVKRAEREKELWERGITLDEDFAKQLDELIVRYREVA